MRWVRKAKDVINILLDKKNRTLLSVFIFLSLNIFLCFLLYPDRATGGPYLDSAHGSSSFGVDRTSLTTFGYSKGNCTHCHEQHTSIGGAEPLPNTGPDEFLLFDQKHTSQTVTFCYDCHQSSGYQNGMISINRSYSYNFGGNPTSDDNNILSAFSHTMSGSSHWLDDILTIIQGGQYKTATGQTWNLSNSLHPCDACHNPHRAQRNYNTPYDRTKPAISRPSAHNSLWGNQSGERMNNYTYQSPYWSNSTSYEPANDLTSNGSNQPDYATFCTDCHNRNNTITTNNPRFPGSPKTLNGLDFVGTYGYAIHGSYNGSASNLMAPYSSGINYTLSCLDCHEPHGSPNIYLLRTEVNAKSNISVPSSSYDNWTNFCIGTCHSSKGHGNYMGQNCYDCHKHGMATF